MYIKSNMFSLSITDTDGKEFESQRFNIDFMDNRKMIYNISIKKNSSGKFDFILIPEM